MKLIVGLGNPSKEYEKTRHNIGFMLIDAFARYLNVNIDKKKFNGLYNIVKVDDEQVLLLKPQSYMNLSGEVVRPFVDYFKIDISDVLVISDDLDMDFGRLRLKMKGSSGGHNGLKNIEDNLHTNCFKRLKFGISNNKLIDTKDYVLSKFSKEDLEVINDKCNITNNILSDYLKMPFDEVMNKYNGK